MYEYRKLENSQEIQLYETATEQVVDVFPTHRDAARKGKFFARGGGFFGFTPAFMAAKVKGKESL